MANGLRLLVVSDSASIAALRDVAADAGMSTEPHQVPADSYHLDVVDLAALIVIAKSVVELAEAIVALWRKPGSSAKISIARPQGSITIESDSRKTVEDLLAELRPFLS